MRMLTFDEASSASLMQSSSSRMDFLLAAVDYMRRDDWLRLLGDEWDSCDIITPYKRRLGEYLPRVGPVRQMMTSYERMMYDQLPDRLTVYRGCGPNNMNGLSWTLSMDVAVSFPSLIRYYQAHPLLVRARVKKESILALKLERKESEVITFGARRTSATPLSRGEFE